MTRNALRLIVLTLLCSAATAAFADNYFTVTLTNGESFRARCRPVPAEWDENVVMINTDRGNWIGLYRARAALPGADPFAQIHFQLGVPRGDR